MTSNLHPGLCFYDITFVTCLIYQGSDFFLEILLENNQDLAEKLTKKAIPTKEYFEIKGDGGHSK